MKSVAIIIEINNNRGKIVDIVESYQDAQLKANELKDLTGKDYDIYWQVVDDDDGRGTSKAFPEVLTVWDQAAS